jgi:predicted ATPase
VEHTYARARELCQKAGETPQLFPVLYGLWLFYCKRSRGRSEKFLPADAHVP